MPGKMKKVNLFRPLLSGDSGVELRWAVSSDFVEVPFRSLTYRNQYVPGTLWDTGYWDVSPWRRIIPRKKLWKAVMHTPGYALSLQLQLAGKSNTISWIGTDYILSQGGSL
jgi:hypothetical protein